MYTPCGTRGRPACHDQRRRHSAGLGTQTRRLPSRAPAPPRGPGNLTVTKEEGAKGSFFLLRTVHAQKELRINRSALLGWNPGSTRLEQPCRLSNGPQTQALQGGRWSSLCLTVTPPSQSDHSSLQGQGTDTTSGTTTGTGTRWRPSSRQCRGTREGKLRVQCSIN